MSLEPNYTITRDITDLKFELAHHPVFRHNPTRLSEIEFERCKEIFERRYPQYKDQDNIDYIEFSEFLMEEYDALLDEITGIELQFKKQLENTAIDVIREMYNIPIEIDISTILTCDSSDNSLDEPEQTDKKQEFEGLPPDMQTKILREVRKRIILNAVVNGSSVLIWKSAHYLAQERINKLDEHLFELYNKYIALIGMILWMQNTDIIRENFDLDHALVSKQGKCTMKCDEESNEWKLESIAMNFPVLLMETNKIVMDYLILHGVPPDFSEDELGFYYALADDYRDEIWHNLLSPALYSDFLEVISTDPVNIPKIIMDMCHWSYEKLEEFFIFVQSDKEKAKRLINL